MKTWSVIVLALSLVATAAMAQGFRCSDQIIDIGTSRDAVLALCGEPTQTAEGSDEIGEGVAIPVEEWLYNFGPTTFPTLLIFRNGILSSVRTLNGFAPA